MLGMGDMTGIRGFNASASLKRPGYVVLLPDIPVGIRGFNASASLKPLVYAVLADEMDRIRGFNASASLKQSNR